MSDQATSNNIIFESRSTIEKYTMACDTCASIASTTGKGSPVERKERSVLVKCGSLQKSAANGCLNCGLIQGNVDGGKSRESNVESLRVRVDRYSALRLSR